MKKILLTIALLATISAAPFVLRAADASTPTNAPAATPPAPTLEQRIAGLEAYIGNGDPSAAVASLKDKDGNLPKDFAMGTLGTPGPGHNAWQMASAALVLFMTLWMFLVYFPQGHMVWGIDGMMNGVWNAKAKIPALDFAGGTVVHMTSGWSALILCLILGKRLGFGKEPMPPHSMVLCMIGTGMLWVGWYGFNAGSAVAADGIAANAFMTTTLATAVASFAWPMAEYALKGKPSILGFCSGAVAGLVVITPACGFVDSSGAMIIGVLAVHVPFFF